MTEASTKPDLKQIRLDAFEAMPEPLQEVAEKIVLHRKNEHVGVFRMNFKIGLLVVQVTEKPDTYGDSAVEQLAAFLNEKPQWLYERKKLATTFTKEEAEKLIDQEFPDGRRMGLYHLLALAQLEDNEVRKALIQRTVTEGLSVDQLQHLIADENGLEKRAGITGRPPKKAVSMSAGVRDVLNRTQSYVRRATEVWSQAFDMMDKCPPEEIKDAFVDTLKQTDAQLKTLEERVPAMRKRIAQGLDRAKQVLNARIETDGVGQSEVKLEVEAESGFEEEELETVAAHVRNAYA